MKVRKKGRTEGRKEMEENDSVKGFTQGVQVSWCPGFGQEGFQKFPFFLQLGLNIKTESGPEM